MIKYLGLGILNYRGWSKMFSTYKGGPRNQANNENRKGAFFKAETKEQTAKEIPRKKQGSTTRPSKFHGMDNLERILPSEKSYEQIAKFLNENITRRCFADEDQQFVAKKHLIKCIPTLIASFKKIKKDEEVVHVISQLFIFCEDLKFFRSSLFVQAYKVIQRNIENASLSDLTNIYGTMINFWQQNIPVCQLIRKKGIKLFQKINYQKESDFLLLVYFMQALGLDQNVPIEEKKANFASLQKPFLSFHKLQSQNLYLKQKIDLQCAILYDIFRVEAIDNSVIFEKLKKYYQSIHMNYTYQKPVQKQVHQARSVLKNTDYIKSRFQIIFEKKLKEMGLNIESNIMLKGNQYDFLIKGIHFKKNLPLAGVNLLDPLENIENQKPFSLQLAHNISNSQNVDFYYCDEKFDEPIIFEVNGPYHHINTDVKLQKEIVRKEVFKYEKLPLYGIYRYATMLYTVWGEKNKFPGLSQQYIWDKLKNPHILTIKSNKKK